MLKKIMKNRKGATIIEYALIASLVAVVAIKAMGALGNSINSKMTSISTTLDEVSSNT